MCYTYIFLKIIFILNRYKKPLTQLYFQYKIFKIKKKLTHIILLKNTIFALSIIKITNMLFL